MTGQVTGAEVERISAENRAEYLDMIDRTDAIADRLEMLGVLLANAQTEYSDNVVTGVVGIIIDGADAIRELTEHVTDYHKKIAEAGTDR